MSDSEEDADLERQVKISLVGEPSTGKSMLCARYLGLQWGGLTQGADVLLGECPPLRPSRPPVPLKLCDVAGSTRDSPMLANYIFASHIILLVYDITDHQSFERLSVWLENVTDILAGLEPVPIFALFGNKSDLEHHRAVKQGCVQEFAEENGCLNLTGSARTGENINATIISLVSQVLGIPINKSNYINSTILKADLAPHSKPLRNVPNNIHHITAQNNETDKKTIEKLSTKKHKKKRDSVKVNKKVMKELKWKATSAVCTLQ